MSRQRGGPARITDEWLLQSRPQYGQIISVNRKTGMLRVKLSTSPLAVSIPIPVFGMSINGTSSSWGVYIPKARDWVRVGHDLHDEPYVDAYVLPKGQGDGPNHRWAGWADMTRLAADNVRGLRVWGDRQEGEWDFRSTGSAQLYLTESGRARLVAGPIGWELGKRTSDARLTSILTVIDGDGCSLRLGEVRRELPGTLEETVPLIPNPFAPAPKEIRIRVGRPAQLAPPGPPVDLFDLWAGDMRDDLGTPVPGPFGVPLRARTRYFQADGLLESLTTAVDALGQVQITQAPAAALGVEATVSRLRINSTLPIDLVSATPVAGIRLGGDAAVQSVPLGELLVAQVSQLTAQVQILVSALLANIGAVSTFPGPGVAAIQGALGPVVGALAQVNTTLALAPGAPGAVLSGPAKVAP